MVHLCVGMNEQRKTGMRDKVLSGGEGRMNADPRKLG